MGSSAAQNTSNVVWVFGTLIFLGTATTATAHHAVRIERCDSQHIAHVFWWSAVVGILEKLAFEMKGGQGIAQTGALQPQESSNAGRTCSKVAHVCTAPVDYVGAATTKCLPSLVPQDSANISRYSVKTYPAHKRASTAMFMFAAGEVPEPNPQDLANTARDVANLRWRARMATGSVSVSAGTEILRFSSSDSSTAA